MKLTIENYKVIEPYINQSDIELVDHFKDLDTLLSDEAIMDYYRHDKVVTEEINEALMLFNELITNGEIVIPKPKEQKRENVTFLEIQNYPHCKLSDRPKNIQIRSSNALNESIEKKPYISPQSRANLLQGSFINNFTSPKSDELKQKVYLKLDPRKHYIVDEAFKRIGKELNGNAIRNYGANVFARELIEEYNSPEHFKMSTIKEVLRIAQSYF